MIRAWHLDLMMIRQRMLLNLPISLVLCLWLGLQTQSRPRWWPRRCS